MAEQLEDNSHTVEQLEDNEVSYGGDSNIQRVEEIISDDPQSEVLEMCKLSSSETISEVPAEAENETYPDPEPIRTNDGTKLSDDGYNSESCYSAETPKKEETSQSLLSKPHTDEVKGEVAYAVPEFTIDVGPNVVTRSDTNSRKRKPFRSIFCGSTFDSPKNEPRDDDMNEKYYNPPADVRDNYFLPRNQYPIIRVLLSSLMALTVAFVSLFLMLVSFNPVISFCVAFVLFIVVFVIPMTLLHQGLLCVIALIFPSIFSAKMKIAGILLMVILIIIGPIIGIANKLNIAATCDNKRGSNFNDEVDVQATSFMPPSVAVNARTGRQISSSTIQEKCITWFENVTEHCHNTYDKFQVYCSASQNTLSNIDDTLCKKRRDQFCHSNSTFIACAVHKPQKLKTAADVRRVLFYLLPLLFLLLFNDAYTYNKVYLTTKYSDNIYITQRLKEFDSERKSRGLTDLILPLTRIEFQTYLVRGRFSLSKTEKAEVIKWLCVLLLVCFITLCFILMEDRIHMVLLNSIMTSPCKEAYEANTSIKYRMYIYILLGTILFITVVQSYMLRLRSVICDQFYPDMVGIRAKHLYYKILHDRHSFSRHIRRKVQLLAEAKRLTRRISCMNMIYHILPGFLKEMCRNLSIKKCMICDSITYWKTVECPEGNCRAHYCFECYVDSGQQCLTCKVPTTPPPHVPNPTTMIG